MVDDDVVQVVCGGEQTPLTGMGVCPGMSRGNYILGRMTKDDRNMTW